MTEKQMEELLADAARYTECEVTTFEEEGVLTQNRGLVLRTPDRAEFQITIVKSR